MFGNIKSQNKKIKKDKLIKINNIAGKTKIFNNDLFQKYDNIAREIVKYRLPDCVYDNENKYGEDLIFTCNKVPYEYIEVQVCGVWINIKFPYVYPFVYARKMKFSNNTLFIMFNKEYTHLIMFGKKSISQVPARLKKYDREMVHYVQWNKAMLIPVEELTLENIIAYSGVNADYDKSGIL
jgi:hypothetical protein